MKDKNTSSRLLLQSSHDHGRQHQNRHGEDHSGQGCFQQCLSQKKERKLEKVDLAAAEMTVDVNIHAWQPLWMFPPHSRCRRAHWCPPTAPSVSWAPRCRHLRSLSGGENVFLKREVTSSHLEESDRFYFSSWTNCFFVTGQGSAPWLELYTVY